MRIFFVISSPINSTPEETSALRRRKTSTRCLFLSLLGLRRPSELVTCSLRTGLEHLFEGF